MARKPFQGQFGLRATGGINKPSFYDFALLHQLGNERLANASKDAIVTRLPDATAAEVEQLMDDLTAGGVKLK